MKNVIDKTSEFVINEVKKIYKDKDTPNFKMGEPEKDFIKEKVLELYFGLDKYGYRVP